MGGGGVKMDGSCQGGGGGGYVTDLLEVSSWGRGYWLKVSGGGQDRVKVQWGWGGGGGEDFMKSKNWIEVTAE